MAVETDYYEALGVSRDASKEEIKRAFRRNAKKWHPDRNPDDREEAERRFREAAESYQVLSDDEKRRAYDAYGHAGLKGYPGADFAGVSIEDLFERFFGGSGFSLFDDFFGFGRTGRASRAGRDIRGEVAISFAESVAGTERTIRVRRNDVCPACGGTGAENGEALSGCPTCYGTGQVTQSGGFFMMRSTCPRCRGTGKVIEKACPDCRGAGRISVPAQITVRIPAGVEDGTPLRVTGQGEEGQRGQRGDLYCYVHVEPDEFFQRQGDDILCEVPVTFAQAALGAEVEIPTTEGTRSLRVPAGTQSGHVFRLRRLGFKSLRGFGRGDQYVRVVIEVPKKLTPRQAELLREFAEIEGKNVSPRRRSFLERLKSYFRKEEEEDGAAS